MAIFTPVMQTILIIVIFTCTFGPTHGQVRLPQPAERIRAEPESVWVEFIQLALDHKPLNLGQGFPDFAAPKELVESLHNVTRQVDRQTILNHQYTRSFGHPRLVRALRDYYQKERHFRELQDANKQILVTVGAYEALFCAIMAFVSPGDEVLIIDPAFDAYAPMVRMAGGSSVYVPLRLQATTTTTRSDNQTGSQDFKLDMREFESKITPNKTKVLVLNTPNNPLGKIYTLDELQEIAKLCIKYNLLVVADEVYEHFYYDHWRHESIGRLDGMFDRTVTIGSFGKTFSVTGWKVGWALGPTELIRYLQLVHQNTVYTVATPLQEALARELERQTALVSTSTTKNKGYWAELRDELAQKRQQMAALLTRAKMAPVVPQGGYFMMANFSELADMFGEQYKQVGENSGPNQVNSDDYRFARWLSKVKQLQGIPGSAFYSTRENKLLASRLIRFCFIKSNETLAELADLISKEF